MLLMVIAVPALAGQNPAISIAGSGTHIDRGAVYSNLPFLSASGGVAPYTFSVSPASALPIGITVNADGTISGATCGSNGNFSGMTATATDSIGGFNSSSVSMIVNKAPAGGCTITFNQSTLPNGTTNTSYSQTLTVTGNNGTVTYSVIGGLLPTGLTLDGSTGTISGTPTAAGTYTFTVLAQDTTTDTGTQTFSVSVVAPTITLSPASLPNGMQGVSYSQTVSAGGGTTPYTYAVTAGTLPAGLLLNSSTGVINGTPSGSGLSNFTITATDNFGNPGSQAYSINIGTPSLTVNPSSLPNATQNAAYSQTVSASGGTGSYAFTVTSGGLPAGLSLNASTGAISGTPATGGSSTFTIQAVDTISNFGSRSYTVNVGTASLALNPVSLPNGTQNAAYSQTVSASGGTGPYTFALATGSLPAGLSLNAGTGVISGTPTTGGSSSFTLQATDSINNTGTRSYTVNIGTASLTVNPVSLPNGTQNVAYNQTVSASGGTGPYTFNVSAGSLPSSLSLNGGTGVISGTPTVGGPSNFTIQGVDSLGNIGTRSYTVNIGTSSLTVNPASLPNGTQNVAYNQTVSASGGAGPYTFSLSAGSLPIGLSLNASTGVISGTPTARGFSNFTIQATDSLNNTGMRAYTLNIGTASLTVNPASLPNGTQNIAYSQTVSASGGAGPYTFALTAGALPAGLSLDTNTGVISGTPTTGGASSFTIQATDSLNNTGARSYTVNIGTASLTVSPGNLPSGTQNTAYNQTVSASGGTGPYTFSISSGALPAGLSLNASTGVIGGTPTGNGASNFTVQAVDTLGNSGTRAFAVNIGTNSLTLNPATLADGTQGIAYNQTASASGGTAPYTVALQSGALPTGLALDSNTGVISGTPFTAGSYAFVLQAGDSAGNIGSRSYSVHIGANSITINPGTLPNGTQNIAYSQAVSASGGAGPYVFSISAGALPTGLSLDSNSGAISGIAAVAGSFDFTIRATDSLNNFATRAYTINIGTNSLIVSPASLPGGVQGTPYNQTISANGGAGPYTFTLNSGSLPAGLALDSVTGALTGTPTTNGTSAFSILTTDSLGNIGSRAYVVSVGSSSLAVNPATLPNATQGTAYNQSVSASGGTRPYSFSVSAGALPVGLSLDGASGAISGTPQGSGAYNFTIMATDATSNTATRAYTVRIGVNILTVSPQSLPNATQNTAYNQTLSASGGAGPYAFAITAGALPVGLSLGRGGVISGTPTGSGPSSFTIAVSDTVGNTGSQAFSVNVGTSSLTIAPVALPNGTQNVAYSQTVTASRGAGPYTYSVSAGTLPVGVTLNSANGVIAGTPTGSGAASFTIRALDALGNVGTRSYAVNIGTASLTINPASLPATVAARSYSETLSATGGTAPYTYSVSVGSLPSGLSLNTATGAITGTPTVTGVSSFTIQVRDSAGNTGSRAYVLSNRADPALDPEVQGLVRAQVAATQRFASAQIDNLSQHLNSLHGEFTPCAINFGIMPQAQAMPSYAGPYQAYAQQPYLSPTGYPGSPSPRMPGAESCASDWASIALWTSGSVQFGKMTLAGLSDPNRFYSGGVTAGMDLRLDEALIVGVSIGYGADRTDIGSNGTRSDASTYSGSLYASFRLFDPLFLDAAVGYGRLGFDNRRFVTGGGALVSGRRSGSYFFGAAAASFEFKQDGMKLAPYVRGEFMSAKLDAYAEDGSGGQALTYQQTSFNSTSAALGLRGSIDVPTQFGVLTPSARIEYKVTAQSVYDQSLFYTDLGSGTASTLTQPQGSGGQTTGAVGLSARTPGGLTAEVEYAVSTGTGSLLMQSIRALLKLAF